MQDADVPKNVPQKINIKHRTEINIGQASERVHIIIGDCRMFANQLYIPYMEGRWNCLIMERDKHCVLASHYNICARETQFFEHSCTVH